MDYEKKYKEALERAKQWRNAPNVDKIPTFANRVIDEIFPELKESEDEKIRKGILELVKQSSEVLDKQNQNNMIAWLEKQGDTTSDIRYDGVNAGASLSVVNGNSFDYEKATITQKDFASVGETATIELSSPIDCGDRIYHVSHKPIEKQGEQKTAVTDFNAKDWYVSKVDGKIHDMTYNPADKVEPKFKIGDYIVSDYCMGRVVEITSDAYLLDIGQGIPFSCEDKVHLWTIADANEGNILAGKIDGDNYILIFKTIKDGWIETYGHYYNAVNRFCAPSQLFCRDYQGTLTPATKGQHELLFKKMEEAGYQWDAEKKELKLLITNGGDFEPKQEWSEEDDYNLQCMIAKVTSDIQKGNVGRNNELIDWLKSLKERVQPQPKQEWSEKDKNVLEDIKEAIINYWHGDTQDILLDWLKSLKDKIKA